MDAHWHRALAVEHKQPTLAGRSTVDFDNGAQTGITITSASMPAFMLFIGAIMQGADAACNGEGGAMEFVCLAAYHQGDGRADARLGTDCHRFWVIDSDDPAVSLLLEQLFQNQGRIGRA